MKSIKKLLRFAAPGIALVLLVGFAPACGENSSSTEEVSKAVEEEPVVEAEGTQEEVYEIEKESPEKEEEDLSKDVFLEKIEEYNIIHQATVYAGISYEIALDWSDEKITKEDASLKYLELATQIGKDFFLVDIILEGSVENITPEQENIIGLIRNWSEKMKNSYKYYSDYLDTGQAEYEIKADELKEEAGKIMDEYIELIKEYRGE